MKPKMALQLVNRYCTLQRRIIAIKKELSEHLHRCDGINGLRNKVDDKGWPTDGWKDDPIHLPGWVQEEAEEIGYKRGGYRMQGPTIIGERHQAECPHCFAAVQLIRERLVLRKSLGAVKTAMTTHGAPKP